MSIFNKPLFDMPEGSVIVPPAKVKELGDKKVDNFLKHNLKYNEEQIALFHKIQSELVEE